MSEAIVTLPNFINGNFISSVAKATVDIINPANGLVIAKTPLSTKEEFNAAVEAGKLAFESWSTITIKQRASIMFKFHSLVDQHANELAAIIVRENGKNFAEALADVAKGNETVDWATGLPQSASGRILEVSKGITCQELRVPLGVVAAIVPFNFPGTAIIIITLTRTFHIHGCLFVFDSHGTYVDDSYCLDDWQLCNIEAVGESS